MLALQGIFVTALYTFARTGAVPAGFNQDLVKNAFVQKKRKELPPTGGGNVG